MNAYFSKGACFLKKYVALVAAVIVLMLVGISVVSGATDADHTIYISGTKGSLSNSGQTPSASVLTFRQAYEGLKDTGGRIYVVNTVSISSDVTLAATYYEDEDGRIDLADGCSVNIMRYVRPSKTIDGYSALTNSYYLIQVEENAKLTLSGITVDGHRNAITEGDPTIIASAVRAAQSLINNKGTLDVKSGAILQNNFSRGDGGAVFNSGVLSLDDVSIQDNYSGSSGGAIYNVGSISFLSDAVIKRNEAIDNGGGIYTTKGLILNQFVSIENNRSDYGGGVYIANETGIKSSLSFEGAQVTGNVAYRGGGIFLQYADMTLVSGQVSGNMAGFGGGIYLNGDPINHIGSLTISGGEVSRNKGGGSMSASIYAKGAGVYNVGGSLVLNNGAISDNGPYSSDNFLYGGGVCQEAGGTFTMNSGTVTGNSATSGGGVYNAGSLDIAGGSVSDNTAVNGGAVYNFGSITADNFKAMRNTASENGGAFFNAGQKVLTVSDSILSKNLAAAGGGIYNLGTLSIKNSDVSTNEADYGAGIYNGDVLTVDGTSVDGNIATINGGGIFNETAEIDISISNVLETGLEFNRDLPSAAVSVVFTDEVAPASAILTDVSAIKDMGVVAWLDGTTYKVSTQRSGVPVMANKDSSYMFKETYYDLESVDFSNFDTSQVENMSYMFYCCWGLTELDVSGFDTRNVTNMTSMFYMCDGLLKLDVSGFDTRNVKTMNSMFYACCVMSEVNLGGKFNTSSVENMDYMFMDCYELKDIDFKNFDTSNVKSMQFMFSDMDFETLNLSNFDTSNVENMECMFANNREATYLDLSSFDTSSVTNMEDMFYNTRKLERVTLGENFVFVGENSHFEAPNSQYVTGATGNWYNTNGEEFAPDEIPNNVGDTYFASPLLVTKDVPKNVPGIPDIVEDSGESEIVPIPGSIVTGQGLVTVCGGSVSNNEAKNGAGIYNNGDIDFVSALANVEGNTASTRGGGIYSVSSLELSSYASICRNLANFGGGVYMADGSVLTLNGASVMQNEAASGGGVWLQFADMNMVAGSIHENKAGTGAGIYLNGNLINGGKGTLTLLDGKIEYNEGKQKGAGIYNYCGAIVMKGGSISYNVPYVGSGSLDGGGIYLNASATLDMSGGVISNNEADQGAGIFMIPYGAYPEATIRGDSLITGNIASFYGGGICNYACKLTVDETAVISSNTAHQGGGIYHISSDHEIEEGYGTAYINGGTITDNSALYGSGIYNSAAIPSDIVGGKLIISGGKITNNKPSSSDDSTKDGVYNFHATINMSGGLIEKSEIGIYNDNGKVTISGNTAEISSCGQYGVYQDGLFQVKDGPEVSPPVFLTPEHYITVIGPCTSDFIAAMDEEDTFEGRVIANYTFDASGQRDLYSLDENTKGYADAKGIRVWDRVLSEGEYPYCILLEGYGGYVDGVSGSDDNTGSSPSDPVKTFKQAYMNLQQTGGTIYVVDTVSIDSTVTLTNTSYSDSTGTVALDSGCEVTIKRYAKPTTVNDGYHVDSNLNSLVQVKENGNLILRRITVDGHKDAYTSENVNEVAGGVEAHNSLIVNSGTLILDAAIITSNAYSSFDTYSTSTRIKEKIYGGGIYNSGSLSILNGSVVSENEVLDHDPDNISEDCFGAGIYNIGTIELKYGFIENNQCDPENSGIYCNGGGVCNEGTMTMAGGEVRNNNAGYGGGIYNVGILNMSGGKVSKNKAGSGAGIMTGSYDTDSVFNLSGNAEISENAANQQGGGVYLDYGTFNMSSGKVTNNIASNGGGMFLSGMGQDSGKGVFKMTGGEITYNKVGYEAAKESYVVVYSGAGIYAYGVNALIEDGKISYNGGIASTDCVFGAGAYVEGDTLFTMTGGEISHNDANADVEGEGGGIYLKLYSLPTVVLKGDALITENTAKYGGGVMNMSCQLYLEENAVISKNVAEIGGGVYNYSFVPTDEGNYGHFYMLGGIITLNEARYGSGVFNGSYYSDDTVGGYMCMTGGVISDNKPNESTGALEDGVCNWLGILEMSGGVIEKSKIGLYNHEGTVTMRSNSQISDCETYGVYQNGLFQVKDSPEVSQSVFLTPGHFITVIGPCNSDFIAAMDEEDTFEGRVIANYTFDASGQKDLYSLDGTTKGYADARGIGVGDKVLSEGEYPYCILLVEMSKEYTIYYNGNTADGGSMEPDRHVVGEEKALSENGFTKTGYTFTGWNTAADGSGTGYSDKQIVKDLCVNDGDAITLYAQWDPIEYTVRYHANGGSGVMADSAHVYDTEKTLTENSFTRKGYEFVGWATSEGGNVVYQDEQSVKNLTTVDGAVVNLYAVWKVIEYKITYDPYGGTMPDEVDDSYTIEDEVRLPEPTKPGYEFEGWREDTDGDGDPDGEVVTEIPKGETGDKHFIAEWKPITYKVRYNANGGTGTMADSVHTYDVEAALSENGFIQAGYDFVGWNTKPDGSGVFYADQQVVKNLSTVGGAVIELYAQWTFVDAPEPDPPVDIPETPISGYLRFIKDKYLETLPSASKWRNGVLQTVLVDTLSEDLTDTSDCAQVWRIPADEFENIHEWCKDHDKGSETNQDFLFVFGKYRED